MSYAGGAAKDTQAAAHRRRLGAFMEQLIGRPVASDRVLDLSFCAELCAADFHAVALTLRDTSMFAGLRCRDLVRVRVNPSPNPNPNPNPDPYPNPNPNQVRGRLELGHSGAARVRRGDRRARVCLAHEPRAHRGLREAR